MDTPATQGEHTFDEAISESPERVASIARAVRKLIAREMPALAEVVCMRQRTIAYGLGPDAESNLHCYMALQEEHVALGFFHGDDLDDPEGILEGAEGELRYVVVSSLSDAGSPAVRQVIRQASRRAVLPESRANTEAL